MRPRPTLTTLLPLALCLLADSATLAQIAAVPQSQISPTSFRIAGSVLSKTDGHPLARARVTLANVKSLQKPQSIITSEDGKFEFTGLSAGKYNLTGAKSGFISAAYEQHDVFSTAIVTGAGLDTENLVLKIAPNAIIAGKVLDEVGEPVRDATVTCYLDDHQTGEHHILAGGSSRADDLGDYEIPSLQPGTYYLSVNAQPWYAFHPQSEPNRSPTAVDPSLDVAYPLTYYPDVTDPESATPISIRGGEHLQFDLHLSPVPSLHLIVHVPVSDSTRPAFPHLEQPTLGDVVAAQSTSARMISTGTWELTGVPAGRYNVRVTGQGSGSQMNGFDLNSNTQELDASSSEAFCTVKLSVLVPGEAGSDQFNVGLISKNRFVSGFRRTDSKGQIEFENVPAGRYEVFVSGTRRPQLIAQISAEGAEVAGRMVTLTPGANASLSVTLTLGNAEVQGIAKRAGKGFAGAMVVLVPRNPGDNHDLFRRDQSDLDGTFNLHNVLPGTYTLVAIENGWDLDWSHPEVIATYAKQGVTLEVANKPDQTLKLPNDVEIQSK